MQYVIGYDIADGTRRSRVASALLDFGRRVQESVFVAHLDDVLAERMRERLTRLVDTNWGRVHVFEMCKRCGDRAWALGTGRWFGSRIGTSFEGQDGDLGVSAGE